MRTTRRNSIADPVAELRRHAQAARREDAKNLEKARDSIDYFYKKALGDDHDDAWYSLREAVKSLAHSEASREIAAWFDEAADAVTGASASETDAVLMALRDRAIWMLKETPTASIMRGFADAEARLGVTFEGVRFPKAEYGDYFHAPVDVYFFYYAYVFSPFAFLPWAIEKILAALRSTDAHEFLDETLELVNTRHRAWAESITDEELANAAEKMNELILERYEPFGTRTAPPADSPDVTTIAWADVEGGGRWVIFQNAFFGGVTYESELVDRLVHSRQRRVRLDANQVILPYPQAIVDMVVSSLYPLPSASQSFHAKRDARLKGKIGPLVSDRAAKGIVKALAVAAEKERVIERYGVSREKADEIVTPDYWQVKSQTENAWKRLVEAKTAGDKAALREVLDELLAEAVPAAFGQLTNWFRSSRLEPDEPADPADWWKS